MRLFRAQGNSRISMLIAGLINIVNLIGNSLFIFVFKWGVGGAALSSVLSRGTAAVAITILLLNPEHTVSCGPDSGFDRIRSLSAAFADWCAERTGKQPVSAWPRARREHDLAVQHDADYRECVTLTLP
ncbi:MAG: hypothetical protein ACLT4C_05480 [Butyricicoccus sp.]